MNAKKTISVPKKAIFGTKMLFFVTFSNAVHLLFLWDEKRV